MKKIPYGKILCLLSMTLLLTACPKFFQLNNKPSTPIPTPTTITSNEPEQQKIETKKVTPPAPAKEEEQKEPEHYLQADRPPPQYAKAKEKCTEVNGQQVCGYDCKTANGITKCAQDPKQRCVVSGNGKIACGYDCKKTDTDAACGAYLYDNCVTNDRGEVLCGNNCYRRDDDELICGK